MQLFVQALSHLDASLWSPRHGISGGSWWVDLTLTGPQDEEGMILDFGIVKTWAKQAVDAGPDHTLLVPAGADGVQITELPGRRLRVVTNTPYEMMVEGPAEAFTLLPVADITQEFLEAWLTELLHAQCPVESGQLEVRLREEVIDGTELHYSHGLRLHRGNCQRIAHGHRSRLTVWRNGEMDTVTAKRLGSAWDHGYLYDVEDRIEIADDYVTVGYQAEQGEFRLTLPQHVTHPLDTPTTVEWLAQHLSDRLAANAPGDHWRVMLFEGIEKGAIAEYVPSAQ